MKRDLIEEGLDHIEDRVGLDFPGGAYDRWKADDGRGDDPQAAKRVDAMNAAWHEDHREHEPSCHLCREIQRLGLEREMDDLQTEYVRPQTEAAD